jgi:hypothetical protein
VRPDGPLWRGRGSLYVQSAMYRDSAITYIRQRSPARHFGRSLRPPLSPPLRRESSSADRTPAILPLHIVLRTIPDGLLRLPSTGRNLPRTSSDAAGLARRGHSDRQLVPMLNHTPSCTVTLHFHTYSRQARFRSNACTPILPYLPRTPLSPPIPLSLIPMITEPITFTLHIVQLRLHTDDPGRWSRLRPSATRFFQNCPTGHRPF